MTRLRRQARLVLRVEDTPDRVAFAFGLGIFIAFFPLLGIHIALALVLAYALRLNRVAILVGALASNPWTLGPLFTAGTLVGCGLLGVSPASLRTIDWSLSGRAFYDSLLAGIAPLVLPFVLGNLVLGTAAGIVAFVVVRAVLVGRRQGGVRQPDG